MTSQELNLLKAASGCGATAIYRVAKLLDRAPYAWEVVYYTYPRKGRRAKYLTTSTTPKRRAALAVWNGIGALAVGFQLQYQDAHKALVDNVIRDIQFYHLSSEVATKAIDSWIERYDGIPWEAIKEGSHQQCFEDGQDLMLKITMALKSIIYGG